jgi:mycothiol synthase
MERPPRDEDAPAVAELGRAFDLALLGEADWTVEDVVQDWQRLDDRDGDAFLFEDGETLVGYGTVELGESGRLRTDGYVHPDHFGRGIGTRILERAERRAAELDGATVVQNGVLHADAAARALLEGRGYARVRSFMRMVIDLPAAPPEPVAGIDVTTFRPGLDDMAVHAAIEEAFAQEWGHLPETLAAWQARKFDDPRFDPTLWFVAREGDEVAGVANCTWKQFDMGFVNGLAVRPAWRRRGLGRMLLLTALQAFAARGETRAGLGVDAQNPTDAVRLYERAGMRQAWRADIYELPLPGNGSGPPPAAGERPAE